jgi:hypothetical protein
MPYRNFEDSFVYGPLTKEEFDTIPVNHRMTYINGELFIGVNVELEQFADRLIPKPVQVEQPTEE